ncbi:formylglycine-generating enzyme family protein [bacterium]|nr:formylglycine-generating enzyme family protein [bacterium]
MMARSVVRGLFVMLVAMSLFFCVSCGCGDDDDDDDDDVSDDDAADDDAADDDADDDDATDDDAADDDATDDDADDDDDAADDDSDDDTGDDDTTTEGFAFIAHGTFTMGSPPGELGHSTDEVQHEVTLTNDFEMSVYETTQSDFAAEMGWNPSFFGPNGLGAECGDDCPVEFVSWYDALAYANEFSVARGLTPCYIFAQVKCVDDTDTGSDYMACMNATQKGIKFANWGLNGESSVYDCDGFRLPTEAEWEYATRAGTTTAIYNGEITQIDCSPIDPNLNQIAWYCGNSSGSTLDVGQKLPNDWGLYDTIGNVFEWTGDWYDSYAGDVTDPSGPVVGTDRVVRGGAFASYSNLSRSAFRPVGKPELRVYYIGVRLVRSLDG